MSIKTDSEERVQQIDDALLSLHNRINEYENVLRFYADHNHWMGITEDDDQPRLLVGMTGSGPHCGYSYAEGALKKFTKQIGDDQ